MNGQKSEEDGGVSLELLLSERINEHQECLDLLSFTRCQCCPQRHGQMPHRCSDLSTSQEITFVKRRSTNGVANSMKETLCTTSS